MIAVAILNTYAWYKKKIYVNNPTNSLPLGRELEVVLLQVTRRDGIRRKRFMGQSHERVICENSKCSYIERTFTFYCNKN